VDDIADRGEGDEPDAVRELRTDHFGDADREPGFSDATGAGEGDETDSLSLKKIANGAQLAFAADEGGQRARQRNRDENGRFWGAEGDGTGVGSVGGGARHVSTCPVLIMSRDYEYSSSRLDGITSIGYVEAQPSSPSPLLPSEGEGERVAVPSSPLSRGRAGYREPPGCGGGRG
jgi:hypothetical protein